MGYHALNALSHFLLSKIQRGMTIIIPILQTKEGRHSQVNMALVTWLGSGGAEISLTSVLFIRALDSPSKPGVNKSRGH